MENALILLPGYNVARHLPALVASLHESLPGHPILLVDDGSADDTAQVARGLDLMVVEHPQNRGKGAALATGFAAALQQDAPAVICLDSDGQHLASEAPGLLAAWKAGGDLIIGSRMKGDTSTMPWLRKATNHFTSSVVSLLAGAKVDDSQSGYRLLSRPLLEALTLESQRYDAESEMIIKAGAMGFDLRSAPISTIYGDEESSINKRDDTIRFFRLIGRALRWRREAKAGRRAHDAHSSL